MARSSKVWPKWDVQKHRIRKVDALFIDPVKYADIGKHFNVEQFREVEAALKAPAEYALLDKMREAVCVYLSADKERRAQLSGGLAGDLHYFPKKRRDKYVQELITTMQEFSNFLDEKSLHLATLSDFDLIKTLQDHVCRITEIMKRGHEQLSDQNKAGQKYAEWHIFLWAIALIFETVHAKRPAIPRYSDTSLVNPGELTEIFWNLHRKAFALLA